MPNDYVVSIGASAGGLEAIQELLKSLPKKLNAPIVIAVHSNEHSLLAKVLSINIDLPLKVVENKDTLKKGMIYVVPGARHVFFKEDYLELSEHVEDSGFRPSIDAMFMTMAATHKQNSIAVVLSGLLKDGMRGAQIVYDMGGQTIVQDPKDAKEVGMPNSVIYADHPEAVLKASELGEWLSDLIGHVE
jgi:two-component system chemotaxis response regulator CheB